MAKPLTRRQPTSSIARLLDRNAAMRAIAPNEAGAACLRPAPRPEPVPETPPPAPGASQSDEQSRALLRLMDSYEYLYGATPRFTGWCRQLGPDGERTGQELGPFGAPVRARSVLETAILLSYARARNVGLLVIDPHGEFCQRLHLVVPQGFPVELRELIREEAERVTVLEAGRLVMDRWEIFERMLAESRLFEMLQVMSRNKVMLACNRLVTAMRLRGCVLSRLAERPSFAAAWQLLGSEQVRDLIYSHGGAAASRFAEAIARADLDRVYREAWLPVASAFSDDPAGGRLPMSALWDELLATERNPRPAVAVDLADRGGRLPVRNDEIRSLIINRLLEGVTDASREASARGDTPDVLVVIDRGTRFRPSRALTGVLEDGAIH